MGKTSRWTSARAILVYLVINPVTFRKRLRCQCKARCAVNGPALYQQRNAAMAERALYLRASQEAFVRGVMPLGKGWAIPCEACLAAKTSWPAECYSIGDEVH